LLSNCQYAQSSTVSAHSLCLSTSCRTIIDPIQHRKLDHSLSTTTWDAPTLAAYAQHREFFGGLIGDAIHTQPNRYGGLGSAGTFNYVLLDNSATNASLNSHPNIDHCQGRSAFLNTDLCQCGPVNLLGTSTLNSNSLFNIESWVHQRRYSPKMLDPARNSPGSSISDTTDDTPHCGTKPTRRFRWDQTTQLRMHRSTQILTSAIAKDPRPSSTLTFARNAQPHAISPSAANICKCFGGTLRRHNGQHTTSPNESNTSALELHC
jgi:hypothetical protein